MITKINPVASNNINFKSGSGITRTGYAVLSGNSAHQTNSLKSVCKEILLRINNNKKLIASAMAALGGVKLTETAITIFTEDKKDAIRLSMPRGVQGNLFKMQVIKDEKPINTLTMDTFNKLVESFSLNKEHYVRAKDFDREAVAATIEGIYNTVDEPLFQVRMFAMRNGEVSTRPVEKVSLEELPKIEEIKKQKEQEVKNRKIIPTAEQMKNFSMRELIKQQADKTSPKVKSRKIFERKLIPYDKLTPEQQVALRTRAEENPTDKVITKNSQKKVQVPKKLKPIKEPKTSRAKQPKVKLPAGVMNSEVKSKIDEILSLNAQINELFKNFSTTTGVTIRAAYEGFKSNKGKMSFGDLTISTPQRKDYAGHNILNLTDSAKQTSLNISDSEKIISSKIDWSSRGLLPKLKFFSQSEVDEKLADKNYSGLINDALANLRAFKQFIDNKGWQKSKQKVDTIEQIGVIGNSLTTKIQSLTEKYDDIQAFTKSLPINRSLEVRKNYGQVAIIRNSSRLEFINPLGDGSNVIFNKSKSKFGNFTFIIKHDGNKNIEEVFVISSDGKIVKNVNKNHGITEILPANPNQKLKFYSQKELEQDGIQDKLDNLLKLLEEKTTEYRQFLDNYQFAPKVTRKTTQKVKEQEKLSLSSVKDFIANFVNNLQEKAMNFTMMTGYKSSLDSVAKDLQTRFEEFLNKQGK